MFLWQLLAYECLLFNYKLSPWLDAFLAKVKETDSEAMSGLVNLLRGITPSESIISKWLTHAHVPMVPCVESLYACMLTHWLSYYPSTFLRATLASLNRLRQAKDDEAVELTVQSTFLRRLQCLTQSDNSNNSSSNSSPLVWTRAKRLLRHADVAQGLRALFEQHEALVAQFSWLHGCVVK